MQTLMVMMSEKCNLNCSYCGMDKWTNKKIDPDFAINRFKELRHQYPQETIKVDFFGGEPLLQMPMVKYIVKEIKSMDNDYKFFMPTNGIAMTEGILDYLKSEGIDISISLDGLWQNKNRLTIKNKNSMEILLKKKHLFEGLRCHSMITGDCGGNLLENHLWIQLAFGMNPELTLVRDRGTWTQEQVEQLKKGIDDIFEWAVNASVMPNFVVPWVTDVLRYHGKGVVIDGCGVNKDIHTTTQENKTVTCNRFKDDPEALKGITYQWKECGTCRVKNYCHKGCMYEQVKSGGPIPELCDIYKYCYDKARALIPNLSREYIGRMINEA